MAKSDPPKGQRRPESPPPDEARLCPLARILRRVLEERKARRPSYSIRALARDIGLSHVSTANLLKGKARLTLNKTREVALRLKLTDRDLELLLIETRLFLEPNSSIRSLLKSHLKVRESASSPIPVPLEKLGDLDLLSFFTILTVLRFEPRLGLSREELARFTGYSGTKLGRLLQTLLSIKFIRKNPDGRYFREVAACRASPRRNDPRLTQFHLDALELARDAVKTLPPEERYSFTLVVPVPSAVVADLVEICQVLSDRMEGLYQPGKPAYEAHLVSIHSFPLVRKAATSKIRVSAPAPSR